MYELLESLELLLELVIALIEMVTIIKIVYLFRWNLLEAFVPIFNYYTTEWEELAYMVVGLTYLILVIVLVLGYLITNGCKSPLLMINVLILVLFPTALVIGLKVYGGILLRQN
ncbi:MAG: hypothetical protein ACTSPV_16210 [Candidatus Hodarchaeales archaeon]